MAHDAQHEGSSTLSNANVFDGVHLPTPGVERSTVKAYDSASGYLASFGCFVFRAIGLEGDLAGVSHVTWALEYDGGDSTLSWCSILGVSGPSVPWETFSKAFPIFLASIFVGEKTEMIVACELQVAYALPSMAEPSTNLFVAFGSSHPRLNLPM